MPNEDDVESIIKDMANSVERYEKSILDHLKDSMIDPNSKFVLEHTIHASLGSVSQLYRFMAFNTKMIYDLKHAINKLPDWKEFDVIKSIVKNHEEDKQFIKKAKRYFEDLSKGADP
ncbi:MAG TPA: hypothetical protein VFJ51_13880 [Nitrososphaeraceae archaeon]|nr:hypothetical protein [Nitrososphaeraceae archaeon]